MKKYLILATFVTALSTLTSTAMAEGIKGKLGLTIRGGLMVPTESTLVDVAPFDDSLDADTSFVAGGGLIYGITDDLAAEMDVSYTKFDLNWSLASLAGFSGRIAEASTIDFSLGVQYRFAPQNSFVPYVGAGVDVLVNDFEDKLSTQLGSAAEDFDTDTSFGGHLKIGFDYFLSNQIAFNADLKGVLSSEADVEDSSGSKIAKYDPSNFSGTIGFRFFFN